MSTKLSFEAPADFSVGTVKISGESGVVQEWIATPNNRTLDAFDTSPGFYIAEITPAGVRPQSVIFEVMPDTDNTVVMPVFASLASGGNSPLFLNVSDPKQAIEALGRATSDPAATAEVIGQAGVDAVIEESVAWSAKPGRSAGARKQVSIALAVEADPGEEQWQPFEASTSIEFASNRLVVGVSEQEPLPSAKRPRVRLSLAVERVRVERLLLPMYQGGTDVALSPSQFSTSDVELEVTPADPERRALYRALAAGTPDEAVAVKDGVLGGGVLRFLYETDLDPWAAILSGLLTLRFPNVFGRIDEGWSSTLLRKAPWAYDAHVIHARSLLSLAGTDAEARRSAAAGAVAALAKAQALGSPYFTYSNQLIGEMLIALGSGERIEAEVAERSRRLLAKWQRDLSLQCDSKVTFKWRRRDPNSRDKSAPAPDHDTSGVLSRQHGNIVLRGTIELGRIALDTTPRMIPKDSGQNVTLNEAFAKSEHGSAVVPMAVPALDRPPGPANDPNKGRFGGKAERDGFAISCRFDDTRSEHFVPLTLSVEAPRSGPSVHGQPVLFFLHPSFHPQWVSTTFRGHRASVSLKTWGGFTVGAWLPEHKVELECDLSQRSDAPRIVREL